MINNCPKFKDQYRELQRKRGLKTAKFAPAMGTDGKAADYELRYEYAFELKN